MGNLARYQDIVELAKRSGGVDAMLDMVKKGAVTDAAPKLIGLGAAAGAALTVAATTGYGRIKNALANRHEIIRPADAAEQEHREVMDVHDPSREDVQRAPETSHSDPWSAEQSDTTEDDDADRS